jgi:hypothetical protein
MSDQIDLPSDRPHALVRKAVQVANRTDPFVNAWLDQGRPQRVPTELAEALGAISADDLRILASPYQSIVKSLKVIARIVKSVSAGQPDGSPEDLLDAARTIREEARAMAESESAARIEGITWTEDNAQALSPSILSPGDDLQRALEPSAILDSLLSESESKRRKEDEDLRIADEREQRLKEHKALRARLAAAFDHAYAFPSEEAQAGRKPCPDGFRRWSERFVALGKLMRECDESIENLHLLKRLRQVACKDAPLPMRFAIALLLAGSEGESGKVVAALEKASGDKELRRFVLWLPFILDNLWHPFHTAGRRTEIATPPDGISMKEKERAEQAFGWQTVGNPSESQPLEPAARPDSPTPDWKSTDGGNLPAVPLPIEQDQVLAKANRRRQIHEEIKRIQDRLNLRRNRVVEALQHFQAATLRAITFEQDQSMQAEQQRETLADELLTMCHAVREGEFSKGIENILSMDREDAGDNPRLAIHLYRLGWTEDRQGILKLLADIGRLPIQPDAFDRAAPCQTFVWESVRSMIDTIIPWPPISQSVHPWHPDVIEAGPIQAELAPETSQRHQTGLRLGSGEEQLAPAQSKDSQAPPSPRQGNGEETPVLTSTPAQYLLSWREILDALDLPNNAENQRRVRAMNKQFDGPIALPKQGGQPKVSKDKLMSWWNHLENCFREGAQKDADTRATLDDQHDYGRNERVLPNISGHVKKRRGKKSDR